MASPANIQDTPTFTLRIPQELLESLAQIAERDERSVAWIVRRAARNYVEAHG